MHLLLDAIDVWMSLYFDYKLANCRSFCSFFARDVISSSSNYSQVNHLHWGWQYTDHNHYIPEHQEDKQANTSAPSY